MGLVKYFEKDLVGKTFNYLTVVKEVNQSGRYVRMIKAKCVCGIVKNYSMQSILRGDTQSCGCKMVELRNPSVTTHGLSKHPLNAIHYTIKARCYNKNSQSYKYYGAKGVRMCKEWLNDFMSFYNWCMANGWKPGLQIDKDKRYKEKHGANIGKLYSPEYCCIVTRKQNCRNRSNNSLITFNGEIKSSAEWAEKHGISNDVFLQRINRGWNIEKALTVSPDAYKDRKKYLKKWR